MASVRSAIIYSSLAKLSIQIIALASTMIVSRLLTPSEIGTYAVASSVVMIMSEFRLLGAGGYLIRESTITREKVSSALGLTILVSWGLGFLILFLSYPVSIFYELESLRYIFLILSISFFFAPFLSIPISLLTRELEFRFQLKVSLVGAVFGSALTIILIYLDFSFYSLAIGQVSSIVLQAMIMALAKPRFMTYRPIFRNIKDVANFGILNSLSNLFRKANSTVPDLVIGKMGSTTEVSMLSRGRGLILFVQQTLTMGISPVVLPFLSKTKKEGGDVAAAYTRASVMLGSLVVPVLGVVSLASLPTMRLFFGTQWDFAASLVPWLAIAAMFRCIHAFSNDLMIAESREKLMVIKDGALFILLLVGLILAQPLGLQVVASVFLILGVVDFIMITFILKRIIKFSLVGFLKEWSKNILTLVICVITTWYIGKHVPFTTPEYWKPVLAISLILPPIWFFCLLITRHPLAGELLSLAKRQHFSD